MKKEEKEVRLKKALEYIKQHTQTRYERWTSESLDYSGIDKIESVSTFDAEQAVRIALGLE